MLALVLGWAAPGSARPRPKGPASVDAELITVHATRAPRPQRNGRVLGDLVDPRLGKQPALARPPFSAYGRFKLLRRSGAILARGMAWKTRLPNGHDLMISLKDVKVPKQPTAPMTFVIELRIAKAGSTAFASIGEVDAAAGETFFFDGRKHGDGIVVVGLKVLGD